MAVEKMNTICIMCPMGCSIEIIKDGEDITVTGGTCKRGEIYGKKEITAPVRMVTSLVKYQGKVVSVRTSVPVPKSQIFSVLSEIKKIKLSGEISCSDVIAKNIAGTDADIILTANM